MKRALAERAKQAEASNVFPAVGASPTPQAVVRAANNNRSTTNNHSFNLSQMSVPKKRPPIVRDTTMLPASKDAAASPSIKIMTIPLLSAVAVPKPDVNGGPTSSSSANVAVPPPVKSAASTLHNVTKLQQGNGNKRGRKSAAEKQALLEAEQENADPDGWFLKFQNRALVSELRALQSEVRQLTSERDVRRLHSASALKGVHMMEVQWAEMELTIQSISSQILRSRNDLLNNLSDADRVILGQAAQSNISMKKIQFSNRDVVSLPPSTGNGIRIESLPGLLMSLSRLTHSTLSAVTSQQNNSNGDSLTPESILVDYASSLATRAKFLADAICTLLRVVGNISHADLILNESKNSLELHQLRDQVFSLKAELMEKESALEQTGLARNEALQKQKRVSRALNRIAAGSDVSQVLKDTDLDDSQVSDEESIKSTSAPTKMTQTTDDAPPTTSVPVQLNLDADTEKKLSALEATCDSREKEINALLEEKHSLQTRINELSVPVAPPSDETIRKSNTYIELQTQLTQSKAEVEELNEKHHRALNGWSESKASLEVSQKTANELQVKHDRRWKEISGELEDDDGEVTEKDMKVEQEIVLEHKLRQALEAVRMSESTKASLHEAQVLIESLQSQVSEWKSKFEVAESTNMNVANSPSAATASSDGSQKGASSKDKEVPYEKLRRENFKLRKEILAIQASRESARAKVERSEMQCEAFAKQNERLLKQAREKDEVNASALSSILHLRHVSELHEEEKDALEKKVKTAEQLALAARLAANAKERMNEEVRKEKEELEKLIKDMTSMQKLLREQSSKHLSQLSQCMERNNGLTEEVEICRNRCNELVETSSKLEKERSQLKDALCVAEREAKRLGIEEEDSSKPKKRSRFSDSKFTREDLELTIENLMKKLSCPVCDVGQKEIIITNCRHMFCRKCIDKNIKNRNRKCPACGARFDARDINDVFL